MNLNENWKLEIRDKIYKDLEKIPGKDRDRIIFTVEQLPLNPFAGDVEKMKGEENSWRRRVGTYRIFYELKARERIIYVFRIERRASKTY